MAGGKVERVAKVCRPIPRAGDRNRTACSGVKNGTRPIAQKNMGLDDIRNLWRRLWRSDSGRIVRFRPASQSDVAPR